MVLVSHYYLPTGIRINLGYLLDVTEAQALSYNNDYVQIYSNSWGPPDNGFLVQGPGYYSGRTLKEGVSEVFVTKRYHITTWTFKV